MRCGWKYMPEKKPRGYAPEMRQHAVHLYVDGMNLRRIGRHLKVHHRTISLWVHNHAENLPEASMPERVETAELDEIFTFIEEKTESTSSPS